VRDGPPERPGSGPLAIDVDPLVVAGRVGEQVNSLLGDHVPIAGAKILSGVVFEILDR
jgi:hypothetical protein